MRISDWSSDVCSSDLQPDGDRDSGVGARLQLASDIGVEKAREPRRQIAIDAMAANQLLRLHRTRGIDMELQPRSMPPLTRRNGVGLDAALAIAVFIALNPTAALYFLAMLGLSISV